MNSYNAIRSLNAISTKKSFLNTNHFMQPFCVNFIPGWPFNTLTEHKSTVNNNHILFLTKPIGNCMPSDFVSLNKSTTCHHTLLQVSKKIALYSNNCRSFSNETKNTCSNSELSRKEKLKRAVKEYGSTVIVFHVTISLMSLGVCYIIVSSGIDIANILSTLGISGSIAANAGTFVTAYAIHKVFAPVRISITLGATPFIVRYLRRIGFLKVPKNP